MLAADYGEQGALNLKCYLILISLLSSRIFAVQVQCIVVPAATMRICQAGAVDPAELGTAVALPDPALVVLVGVSGAGKSVWAAEHYRPYEVVSSDRLRALVGSGEHDLDASADAFALLDQIVTARLRRGLTAVVDTLGLDPARRRSYLALARSRGMPAAAEIGRAHV